MSAPSFTTTSITSADGTKLYAEVWRPAGGGRVPVVLVVSPYVNDVGYQRYPELATLLKKGYAVAQVSLRGYGPSDGCADLGGTGEQADVVAAVEWAARQPWSTGRVGMWGESYEAWTQLMALATRPRGLAAVIVQSPIVGLYRALYMNGAHYGGVWHAMTASYGADDLTGSGETDPADAPCHLENQTESLEPSPDTAFWRERDVVARAARSRVPVLWSHGFLDVNTKPDNLTALYPLLRGPKRAWVGQFAHERPADTAEPAVRERYVREVFDWLDAYVAGDAAALRRVRGASRAVVESADGRWRRDDAWPPRDAAFTTARLRSGSYVDVPGNDGGTGHDAGAVHWSFSQPLPYPVHLSGVPRVTLTATAAGPTQVVVQVYDVAPDGAARLVTRGAHAGVAGRVSFDLYPQDWRLPAGHRIGVAVLGSDGTFWSPSRTGGTVTVGGASIALPALRYDRAAGPVLYATRDATAPRFTVSADVVRAGATTFRLPPRMRRR